MRSTVPINTVSSELRLPHADFTHVHASAIRGDRTTSNSVMSGAILRIHNLLPAAPAALAAPCGTGGSATLPYSYRSALIGSSCDARRAG